MWIQINDHRIINMEQVTEINLADQDPDGKARVRIYLAGSGDGLRPYTTVTPQEGQDLISKLAAAQKVYWA